MQRLSSISYRFGVHNLGVLEILGADKVAAECGRDTCHD